MNPYYSLRFLVVALALAGTLSAQTATNASGLPNRSPAGQPSASGPNRSNNATGARTSTTSGSNSSSSVSSATTAAIAAAAQISTDPDYRLAVGDEVSISVHGEPDFFTAQRIDRKGAVKMPAILDVNVANKTVREAEVFVEKTLIDKKQLKAPNVNIVVHQYTSREVLINGAVGAPGVFILPREADSIEIVELITRVGGFALTAKGHEVKIMRLDENGKEMNLPPVDVEGMLNNNPKAPKSFLVYPGDRILVPSKIW